MHMPTKYNVIVERGEDGYLIADVVELPGCRTQAKSYDELMKRVKEAIQGYLKSATEEKQKTKFLSLQQIEI